jgi:hypothetical protein
MTPKERELEKENQKLREQIAGLQHRVKELEETKAASAPSKSRLQAEAVKAILDKDQLITREQLAQINPKYPSDPVYYFRQHFKETIITLKTASGTVYMTMSAHQKYLEGKKKEEAAAKKAAATPAVKEEVRQAVSA